jgi:hypothetical protein
VQTRPDTNPITVLKIAIESLLNEINLVDDSLRSQSAIREEDMQ